MTKSLRVAAKAAETSAARLCAAAAELIQQTLMCLLVVNISLQRLLQVHVAFRHVRMLT